MRTRDMIKDIIHSLIRIIKMKINISILKLKIAKKEKRKTYIPYTPPMHPRCRGTIEPYWSKENED